MDSRPSIRTGQLNPPCGFNLHLRFVRNSVVGVKFMRKHNVTGVHAVLVIVLLGFGLERAAAATYTQITVPGSVSTQARAINNTGQIVGSYIATSQTHGYLLSSGQYTTIDFPAATSTTISGINDAGDMVGFYSDTVGATHGFLDHDGALTAINAPEAADTIAYGINLAGQIVGFYIGQTGEFRGFELSGGKYTPLDVPNAIETQPYGINASGDIIGSFNDASGQHGFLLHDGRYQIFNVPGTTNTSAVAISDKGHVVGSYVDPTLQQLQGYTSNLVKFIKVTDPNGTMTGPTGINNSDTIVGTFIDSDDTEAGFMATR